MKKVIIFGNGQMAEIAHVYLEHDSTFEVVGFTVDKKYISDKTFRGLPVAAFEDIESVYSKEEYDMFIPIGAKQLNGLRADKYFQAKEKGYGFISYISSKAIVCPETKIGDNCFIFENNVIQPFASIGDNTILWSGNHIGHHTSIGEHCFISSHVVISGRVRVDPYCYFGVNSTVRDGLVIKEKCIIGAGSLILKNTSEKQVFRGKHTECFRFSSDAIKVS
ncbi:MAG: acetyltransferase [Candidatus Zapsychrus exili]|nr:acetyltransferase [Candidatus Zapsychrus exili]